MRQSIVICGMVAGLAIVASPARAQQLQLPDLARLSAGAVDVVDVSVDQALLGLAASFMSNGTDDKEVKALISSLKGIYVKSFTYGKDGAYDPAVLDSVRRQLSGGQWSRLLAAKSAAEGTRHGDLSVAQRRQAGWPGGAVGQSARGHAREHRRDHRPGAAALAAGQVRRPRPEDGRTPPGRRRAAPKPKP